MYQKYFASLTDEADILIIEKMNVIQEFTSAMYGIKNCNKVNDARYQIFVKNFSAKEDNENFLKKVRSFDTTMLGITQTKNFTHYLCKFNVATCN